MTNILDYIAWRGDLTLDKSPFNRIDALILCQIAYLNFDGLMEQSDFSTALTIADLAESFRASPDYDTRADTGMLINKLTVNLLYEAANSNRFGSMKITGYRSIINLDIEEQFAAMTFLLGDGRSFIAYRGTDDTVVGWKEDFNLAFMDEVPAQKDAVEYLSLAASHISGSLLVGGHSKGGNLSIYAAIKMPSTIKKRIVTVYNNDGPGFSEERLKSPEYQEIVEKISSYYPQLSIVGMIFSNEGKYSVVKSDQQGLMQHDPFSWEVRGTDFVKMSGFDRVSRFFHDTLNGWLADLELEKRELFIETVFTVINATDARTNSEIEANLLQNSVKVIAAINRLDPEMRAQCETMIRELFQAANKRLPRFDRVLQKARSVIEAKAAISKNKKVIREE